ncbi:DOPA 4,5-dioxygenase family protein [Sneathiella chinensis]|uniref:DOPA 4,5-dioxygenase n=1 Tax=Sneathiella chinensis TaxID=349750 RepID=A0ABQ5U9D0_9PROT|nr:DOPA 4,5-dioxygenase family protein [Sneathiella chinensis]GLQ07917.1 DOPA 4,5-dioxygenase [Sneathiella chinensis]
MSTPISNIEGYHAHIYYTPETRRQAEKIREIMGSKFEVILGRWHDKPVGPHPISMYQVAFSIAEFERLVPWLMLNHKDLDVLIHPLTGNDLADHSDFALWLGNKQPLDLSRLV